MSMLLTNDVTLVTLVPFAINVLKKYKDRRRTMYTLILMTVSANLGSMLTPIGNVPAAMLLSTFTKNGNALVLGANLGGFGTIIASMASLITYKFFNTIKKEGEHYLLAFTSVNVVFLVILFLFLILIG